MLCLSYGQWAFDEKTRKAISPFRTAHKYVQNTSNSLGRWEKRHVRIIFSYCFSLLLRNEFQEFGGNFVEITQKFVRRNTPSKCMICADLHRLLRPSTAVHCTVITQYQLLVDSRFGFALRLHLSKLRLRFALICNMAAHLFSFWMHANLLE